VNRLNYVPDSGYMTVTNGFYWSNGGGFISHLPSTAVFSSQVSSPMVADVNGDGTKQVVTAWKIDPDSTSNYQDFNPFINDIWGSGNGERSAKAGPAAWCFSMPPLARSNMSITSRNSSNPASRSDAPIRIVRSKPTCSMTATAWSPSIKPTARPLRQRHVARAI